MDPLHPDDQLTRPLPKNFHPLVSSQIEAFAWLDPKGEDALADPNVDTGTLVIMFISGGWWSYADVPREKVKGLKEAPSAGRFFGQHIKGKPDEHTAAKFSDELVTRMKAKV